MVWSYCICRNKCIFSLSTNGVSKTRGRGRSRGQGQGRGRGHFFIYSLMSFFLSFNPNSDFSQFASAVYRYNIFIYKKKMKKLKKKCPGAPFFASSQTAVSYFSQDNIEVANFFSSSTPSFAIEVHN